MFLIEDKLTIYPLLMSTNCLLNLIVQNTFPQGGHLFDTLFYFVNHFEYSPSNVHYFSFSL